MPNSQASRFARISSFQRRPASMSLSDIHGSTICKTSGSHSDNARARVLLRGFDQEMNTRMESMSRDHLTGGRCEAEIPSSSEPGAVAAVPEAGLPDKVVQASPDQGDQVRQERSE